MYIAKQKHVLGVMLIMGAILTYISNSHAELSNKINIESAPKELHQFIQQIVPIHPRFTAARAELDAVRARYEAASKAIYNPELELDAEEIDIRTSTIELSQTIDWGDQRGARTLIAKHQLQVAQAKFQRERQQLIRELLILLGDYKSKSKLADLSGQRLRLMKDFYTLAKQKYEAGDISQVELNLAQLAYSESILDNAQVFSGQAAAKQAFIALYGTGTDLTSISLPDLSFNFHEIDIPANLDAFLLTLPQMRMVRANVEASKNTIALRESESSADPTIALRGGKEDKESLAGLTITIPLNVRNNFSAEIEAARNEYLQSEQLAQQAYRDLRRDITSLTRHYQLTFSAWRQWQESGQISMNRQLNLLKILWGAGDMNTTDYLVQIKQNLDTQSAGIELQATLLSSWLTWLEATAQIEPWLQLNDIRNH